MTTTTDEDFTQKRNVNANAGMFKIGGKELANKEEINNRKNEEKGIAQKKT